MSMVKGDKFTLAQWASAVKNPVATRYMPKHVVEALDQFQRVCKEAGIPVLVVTNINKETQAEWDFGSNPAEVTGQMIMARATVMEDPSHASEAALTVMNLMKSQM